MNSCINYGRRQGTGFLEVIKVTFKRFFILVILLFLIFYVWNAKILLKVLNPIHYKEEIFRYSEENSLDPYLVVSIVRVESKFDKEAISSKGAMGLMQVYPKTAEWIAPKLGINNYKDEMLFDPEINIKIGCWYLAYLFDYFKGKDIKVVLAAYNAGIGNVERWLRDERYSIDGKDLKEIPFDETRDYIEKVLRYYEIYKNIYGY